MAFAPAFVRPLAQTQILVILYAVMRVQARVQLVAQQHALMDVQMVAPPRVEVVALILVPAPVLKVQVALVKEDKIYGWL